VHVRAEETGFKSAPQPAGGNLEPGTVVDGQLEVRTFLGKGGMCVVYLARDTQFDRQMALKFLQVQLVAEGGEALRRFKREALAASALNHPNIVKTYRFGIWKDRPYIALEYLKGSTLAQLLSKEGALPKARAVPIFLQICDALDLAHRAGVIHRDLKPSNVMVTDDGQVKLVDFGIAKILPESGKELQKLTQTNKLLGTFAYMSPEQLLGQPADTRSDIYSMGCLMYEVLSGKPLFDTSTVLADVFAERAHQPAVLEGIDEQLRPIIVQSLAKQPSARQQSAAVLKGQLLGNLRPSRTMKAAGAGFFHHKRLWLLLPALLVVGLGTLLYCWGHAHLPVGVDGNPGSDDLYIQLTRVHDLSVGDRHPLHEQFIKQENQLAIKTLEQQSKDHCLDSSKMSTVYRYLLMSYLDTDNQQFDKAYATQLTLINLRFESNDLPEIIGNEVANFAGVAIKAGKAPPALVKIAEFRQRLNPRSVDTRKLFDFAEAVCYAAMDNATEFDKRYQRLREVDLSDKWRHDVEYAWKRLHQNR